MIEYSKFYTAKHTAQNNDLPKNEEKLRKEAEWNEHKELIQRLGYARFDD